MPADAFLDACPTEVAAQLLAVLDDVAEAPPPRYSGAPTELRRRGLARPGIAVIGGLRKPWLTAFSARDYESIRRLGDEHRRQHPRRIRE